MLHREILPITVNASGAGSATTSSRTGLFHSVRYVKSNYADGIDFTVTVVNTQITDTLLSVENVNASATYAPRMDRHTTAGSAASANDVLIPFVGALKVTVAEGGNATSGTFVLYWLDADV